jgi:hypothetical protein
MEEKRQKSGAFVESIIDSLSKAIVALSLNPARYCAIYGRPSIRNSYLDALWISSGMFSMNEPGVPSGLTGVRMPKGGEGWEDHRPFFLTHEEAARWVRLHEIEWTQCMDFAFAFSSDPDSFRSLISHEQLLTHERVEVVTGKYMVDMSEVAVVGMDSTEEYLNANVLPFSGQVIPMITRMLGRFYPGEHNLGYYVNFGP